MNGPQPAEGEDRKPTLFNFEDLPPLPTISGDPDILLDLFTHHSILFPGAAGSNKEYGDTKRLAYLGQKVYDMLVTEQLFKQQTPQLSAEQLQTTAGQLMDPSTLSILVSKYALRDKVRCTPDAKEGLRSPEETRFLWFSYIGALYIRNGLPYLKAWVTRILDPTAPTPPSHSQQHQPQQHQQAPQQQTQHQQYPMYGQQYPYPAQPATEPPPLPPGTPPAGGMPGMPGMGMGGMGAPMDTGSGGGGGPASHVTLALMNQTAQHKRYQVTYNQQQSGPPHMPLWHAQCLVNNEPRGNGQGKSVKDAKQAAAQMAWISMGW